MPISKQGRKYVSAPVGSKHHSGSRSAGIRPQKREPRAATKTQAYIVTPKRKALNPDLNLSSSPLVLFSDSELNQVFGYLKARYCQ